MHKFINCTPLILFIGMILMACNSKEKKSDKLINDPISIKKDTPTTKATATAKSAPIINITDTLAIPYHVIYIKDSALTAERLAQKLALIYGEKLAAEMRKAKLKPSGPPMAWYKSQKAPFFFEAGIAIDKKPGKLSKGIGYRKLSGDSAVVAHFFGPYEETSQGYEALKEWLKDRKKKPSGAPYEVYIGDPIGKDGKAIDPYKVQTDIVFPHQ
jgi:effector-binding domain-containing protein